MVIPEKIGSLTIEEIIEDNNNLNLRKFKCKCKCGNTCIRTGKVLTQAIRKNQDSNCGCIYSGNNRTNDQKEESITRCVFNSYKDSARRRGLLFDITFSFLKETINQECIYCGLEKSNKRQGQKANKEYSLRYNGIDRKNSAEGYTEENCVPCCYICNRAKSNLDFSEWESYIERLKNFNL